MGDLLSGFIGACIVAAAGLLVAGVVAFIRRRVKLTSPQTESIGDHTRQIAKMQPLVVMLVRVQKPQLIALLCILDTLKEKANGDFERAYSGVKVALDEFDEALMGIVRNGCEEKEKKP